MQRILLVYLTFLIGTLFLFSQKNNTVESIYDGTFRTKGMEQLESLKKSNHYTVLNTNRNNQSSQIDLFDFATLKKVKTLFDSSQHPEISVVNSYQFSEDETKLLIATNSASIYRRSFLAHFFVFDLNTQKLTKVSNDKIQEPTFSPNGQKVAYVYQNNLFVIDLASMKVDTITTNGQKNKLIHGITDWVYEEEFGFVRAFEWSANSEYVAFLSFDETEVPEFSMDVYGTDLYPTQEVFKYPKAGEKNAQVSLNIYQLQSKKTQLVDFSDKTDFYIARLQSTKEPQHFVVQVLNRHQNKLELTKIEAAAAQKQILLTETDDAYVDVHDHLTFLDNHQFIWSSEKDGYLHFYLHDKNGKQIRQITKGAWEVTSYYGYDDKTKQIFYQSTEPDSKERGLYAININGKNKRRLSEKSGTNSAKFSPDFKSFILTHTNLETPNNYSLVETKSGKTLQLILDNTEFLEKLKPYQLPTKTFLTLKNALGNELNAYIIKPTDFNEQKTYPLLMFQYSGPGSQQVADRWHATNDYWHMMLAQQGYLVVCVDGRGTGYKGRDFKKTTQLQLGKYEVEDQIFAAKYFGNLPYVDANRIGIWGWSYGGFMSSNCLLQGADVFKMAIAVAPVTNWRFYDTIYTERYMKTPQENPRGYDDNSPINHLNNLQGKYLIIHGTADDNVHVQNAMRMIRALQLNGKDFDQAIYPDTNHGIYGGKIRIQLYQKMTDYILKNL